MVTRFDHLFMRNLVDTQHKVFRVLKLRIPQALSPLAAKLEKETQLKGSMMKATYHI